MYNSEVKERFIKNYTKSISSSNLCETTFNSFQPYEEEWGKDLCTMECKDLQPIIDEITGIRMKSKTIKIIILKDYVKWCIANNVDGACDGMLHVTNEGIEKIKKCSVSSPKHLQRYLDIICEPEDRCTTDIIYRCYYWLAYAGMAEEDIMKVKASDVDFSRMEVAYEARNTTVPIYREALQTIKSCVELNRFVYNHPNFLSDIWKDRAPGNLLIRGIKGQPSVKTMRVELSRRSKDHADMTPLKLSYSRVWLSGEFYRKYEDEISGIDPDFSTMAKFHMFGRTYKLDSGNNTLAIKERDLTKDFKNDYERWKLAWLYSL